MKTKNILVTGANGFIGDALIKVLVEHNFNITGMHRLENLGSETWSASGGPTYSAYTDNDIVSEDYWINRLKEIDIVVHLAGRAHVLKETASNPEREFKRINTDFTRALVSGAISNKVSKFVYLSTIGVHGRFSRSDFVNECSPVHTDTPYSLSKWQAEELIRDACRSSDMTYVILRPPLVYGAHVKGNFLRLLKWAYSGFPFVFASINNTRSFININNLTNIILSCMSTPAADNQAFVVSDAHDLSTSQLVKKLCTGLEKRCVSLPVPAELLRLAGRMFGKTQAMDSLIGDYKLDISKLTKVLDWKPPYTVDSGLQEVGKWFNSKNSAT